MTGLSAIFVALAISGPGLPPQIFRSGETVLFQGDSITDGNRGRSPDPNHILGHGYVFVLAAKYGAAFPDQRITFVNRGVSGNTVSDLTARWDADTIAVKPSVLSILVGINDINFAIGAKKELDIAALEAGYDELLKRTKSANPDIRLVLCEPITLDTGSHRDEYELRRKNVEAVDAIVARLAAKYHAPAVHFQRVFDQAAQKAPADYWIWDGIHPTYRGHQLIADEWVRVYNDFYVSPLDDPNRNSAIFPEVNFERDSYDWLHRHADVLDEHKKGNADVVMIGDSITNFWGGSPAAATRNGQEAWNECFGKLRVLNMGFGWDRTQNVLWRFGHGELDGLSPKTVVINIGTNNLVGDVTARTNTPEEVAIGIRRIVDQVAMKTPATRIVVMGVFPRGYERDNPLDLSIRKLNGILLKSLAGLPNVLFLDIGARLRDSTGLVTPENFSDGTHPTNKGYQIWSKSLHQAGVIPAAP